MEEIPAALWISLMIPPYLLPPFTTLPLLIAFHFFISIKLSSLIMMHYEKTSVNCFFFFFFPISCLLAFTRSYRAYSNCTCMSTHNSFCGRWSCQKAFLTLFMPVIPHNSVPAFPKMYSKELLQIQSPEHPGAAKTLFLM